MKTSFDFKKNQWNSTSKDHLAPQDVVFLSPVPDPTYGLPIGDGNTGCLIWLNEKGLEIQINNTDLWDDTTLMNYDHCSSEEENLTSLRHGAKLTIDFQIPCFELIYQKDFEARLSLYDAVASIKSVTPFSDISLKAFACHSEKVTVIEWNTRTNEPIPIRIDAERWGSRNFWRWYSQMKPIPEAGLEGTNVDVSGNGIYITQKLNGTAFCVGMITVSQSDSQTHIVHSRKASTEIKPDTELLITIYLHIAIADTVEEARTSCKAVLLNAQSKGVKDLFAAHQAEWHEFWDKSFVSIPNDFVENLWYLNLYYANSECRGKYPPLFCNGIWGFYHDFVPWNYYFHYNMQLHNFPLHAANHPELLENYYRLKRDQLSKAEKFCETYKQVKGAFYTDVYDRNGYNDSGTIDNCTCGAQVAFDMWKHYCYTGDEAFLEDVALPVMRSTALFYRNILHKEDDNLYHIHGTQAYEGTPLFDDSITDLTMIRALFNALLAVENEKNAKPYRDILENLAPYHFLPLEHDETNGFIITEGLGKGIEIYGDKIVSVGKQCDDGKWKRKNYGNQARETYYGFPDTELSPLYPAGVIGIKDRGTVIYNALVNQIHLHPHALPPQSNNEGSMEGTTGICMGWCMAPIYLARLGLSKELNIQLTESAGTWTLFSQGFGSYGPYSVFFPDNQLRWKKNNPRNIESGKQIHMPAWNFRHFDYEPMPILATAVNEMLLQSYDGSLRLFPAVLPDDTVRFSLAAENGIIISAEKNGDSFIASIECSVTQTCRLILPEYIDTHIYCYIVQGEHFKEIDYVANSNGTELEYLIPMVSGVRYFVSSEPVEKLVIIDGEHPIPNSLPKYCGISKLGEERMF